jgi:transglutaminase-like putative cysteine protease
MTTTPAPPAPAGNGSAAPPPANADAGPRRLSLSGTRPQADAKPLVSLLGAVTVLAGGAALLPIIRGTSWIFPSVQIVGLIWLIGVGCRLLRAAAPITVLAQATGAVLTLTALFTSSGYGGIIPNLAVLREANRLLAGAWEQVLHTSVPTPATPEIALLVAIALGLIAIVTDFFVSEADAAALVALPMLCLYSVPASISEEQLPWWSFAIPAACYATLLAVVGHPGRRVGWRAGVGLLVAAGVVATVSIAASVGVGDRVTAISTAGRLERTNAPTGGGNIGLSPFASLIGDLTRGQTRDVLQVESLPEPDYLRITALENWDATQGFSLTDVNSGARRAGSPIPVQALAPNPASPQVEVSVKVLGFSDRFVPFFQGTTLISGLDAGYAYNAGLGSVFRSQSTTPRDYRLLLTHGALTTAALAADTVTPTANLTAANGVPATVIQQARSITASGRTPFDKAVLLKDFFTDGTKGFKYSLQVPPGNSGNLLADFLTNKQGYCEQYAAAMAVMLRTIGIPARVAVGFTQGTQTGPGRYLITSHDAHAWVEVKFDRSGWVRFDPTPLSNIGGLNGYQTTAPNTATGSATATTDATGTADTTGAATGETTATVTDFEPGALSGEELSDSGTPFWSWFRWVVLVVALLLVAAAAPAVWRRRKARHRLTAAASGGPDAPAAAWAEIEALAADHGFAPVETMSVRRAANQLAREGQLGEAARAALRRIALGTEVAWYSPDGYRAEPGVDLAADVRRIAVDLEHAAPRGVVSRLLPASVVNRG